MYVCHCRAVNDRRIRESIKAGATTCGQVARACGAGATCGGCVPLIKRLLDEYLRGGDAPWCPVAAALATAPAATAARDKAKALVPAAACAPVPVPVPVPASVSVSVPAPESAVPTAPASAAAGLAAERSA